ncbi:MAG: galactose mutarotase [Oscillospiraceae bacterium]|jgi:aldose 1-epimerase|nr:galactose mutarotase [Oscillospiraceae bacterium]
MSERISYGKSRDGKDVSLYRLKGSGGVEVEIMDFGAIIRSIKVPGRGGKITDVVMGYENFDDQLSKMGWNCGIMGRVVNRIGDGKIWIRGKLHQLDVPEWGGQKAPFVMHGGAGGYSAKVFSGELYSDAEGEKVTLYHHDRGEGNFPGEVDVWVTYVLTPDNELQLRYRCLPTRDTVLNITSHCYFNLAGHGNGTIHKHIMKLDADYYTPAAPGGLPSGEVLKVDGTAFDFRTPKSFGEGIDSGEAQITLQGGYDHNLCLAGGGYRERGYVYDESTGIKLTLSTDMPGVQLYCSGNEMPAENAKDGKNYEKFGAFCLETQYYPNATAYSHFPQPVFAANQVFESQTAFKFSAE